MSELDELNRQIDELEKKRQELIKVNREAALTRSLSDIRQYGFSAQDLGLVSLAKKAKKIKKPITYRDDVTGKEWWGELTQKGPKPPWIKEKIADGTIEQCRVK